MKEKHALKRLENEIDDLAQEKKDILQAFAQDPKALRDVAKVKRLKDVEGEILAHESAWLDASDRIEILGRELKTARER